MIDHLLMNAAMRAHALSLTVATTGAISIAANVAAGVEQTSAFVRTSGSFRDDGFEVGMEIESIGFGPTNNVVAVVTDVEDLKLSTDATLIPEATAPGRTITAGLPKIRVWENLPATEEGKPINGPVPGRPYFEERYIFGTTQQITLGPHAEIQCEPMYAPLVWVPENVGSRVAHRYVNALIRHFAPGTALMLQNGDTLRVRRDTGPYPGSLQNAKPGFAVVPVTFPFRLRTRNSI